MSLCNCLLRYVYLRSILKGHIKALYYISYINTPYIYVLVWVLCVAYMGYGYKAMLIWWYIYVCVVYELVYNSIGTYKVVHIRYCTYKVVAYTIWTIQACAYDRVYYLICYYLYRYAIAYKGVCAPCVHRWYICVYMCVLYACVIYEYMCMYVQCNVYSIVVCVSIYVCINDVYMCMCMCMCV